MLARLLVWFALFTYIFLFFLHISLPHTYNFEKKLRGKCFPFIILSCFCWRGIQQSPCRMNTSALAMELRAFRQQSVSDTGAGSVMPLLYQHISPGAEPLPGWNAWAPGLLSPFPPTAWTGSFCYCPDPSWASLVTQTMKNLPAMQETQVQSLGGEDLLEKGMATHSSTPAWRIPWTEEPGRLHSMGLQRVRHNWVTTTSRPALQQLTWVSPPRYPMHWKFPYRFSYKNYLIMNAIPEDVAFWISRWELNIGEE